MRLSKALPAGLWILLAAALLRFWITPLGSSFWVDEMVTAFVVHHGAAHPSLAAAPQVAETVYVWLPRASEALLGFSEVSYRIPSLLAMGIALWLIWRLAERLIQPGAGWFAVFACLTMNGFNYEAADARPYALGTCVAAAALWFLVRWLDTAHWRDAFLFVLFAALLWRVQLVFWPLYAVFAAYLLARILKHETSVRWRDAAAIFGLLGLTLVPVLFDALRLFREARTHVIVGPPRFREFSRVLKFALVLPCAGGAFLLGRVFRWKALAAVPALSAQILILGWWLWHPIALFAFSRITGNSVFVDRYLSLALPGAALAAALAVAYFSPGRCWSLLAAALAIGSLYFMGHWHVRVPVHHNSDWRAAARQVNFWAPDESIPVLCPSPFIEAKPPVWRPDYPLPGFLYSHLDTYRIEGKPYLLPFEDSPQADAYAAQLASGTLAGASRFLIYGGDRNVWRWREWFADRPEMSGWRSRLLGPFGDVGVALFENPRPELASR